MARKHAAMTRLSIDLPRQGERIHSTRYTLTVAAPDGARRVAVSIDHGPWRACRRSDGRWEYVWSRYASGEHEVVARLTTPEGAIVSSEPHEFVVDLEPHAEEANA